MCPLNWPRSGRREKPTPTLMPLMPPLIAIIAAIATIATMAVLTMAVSGYFPAPLVHRA